MIIEHSVFGLDAFFVDATRGRYAKTFLGIV